METKILIKLQNTLDTTQLIAITSTLAKFSQITAIAFDLTKIKQIENI